MSQTTKQEVLAKLRCSYARAGTAYKPQLLDQAVALFGYHRKAAICALRAQTHPPRPPGLVLGRPKTYHPETLPPIVEPIWFADFQPRGVGMRALENRGQHATVTQIRDLEASLPFPLRGVDGDNGGEFINHQLVAYLGQRPKPVHFTSARPYQKNDNAHVEQRNWTRVRQHFGYHHGQPQIPFLRMLATAEIQPEE